MNTNATITLDRWNGRTTETVTISLHRNVTGWWAVSVDNRRGMSSEEWGPQFEVFCSIVNRYREEGWEGWQ